MAVLFGASLAIALFDIIVLIVWDVAFTPYAQLVQPDQYKLSLSYYQCSSTVPAGTSVETVETAFIATLGIYKGLQIIAGIVLTYLLRKVPTEYGDHRLLSWLQFTSLPFTQTHLAKVQ